MQTLYDTQVYDIPIFHSKFVVLADQDTYEFFIKNGEVDDEVPEWGESFGCVFSIIGENGCKVHVLSISDHSPGCIAHEALHLTVNLMNDKDIPVCEETEEVQAYLHGFFVDEITRAITDG